MLVYTKAVEHISKSKKIYQKKQISIKELKAPTDISAVTPADIKNLDGLELLGFFSPQERILVVLALRHHMGIDELATVFSTSRGAILTRLNKLKTELASIAINTLKEKQEIAGQEETKACFATKRAEPQYSLYDLKKEEQNKILKHISKCSMCKNFYTWNQKITNLMESISDEKPHQKNYRLIFEKLEKKDVDEIVFHYIKTGWKTRLALLASVIIILAGSFYFFYSKKEPTQNKGFKTTEQQALAKNEIKNILIKITIDTAQKEVGTTTVHAKEMVNMFSSHEDKNMETTSEDDKHFYYTFLTPLENKDSLLEKAKEFGNASVVQETTEQELPNNKVKVEIWVNKNG